MDHDNETGGGGGMGGIQYVLLHGGDGKEADGFETSHF